MSWKPLLFFALAVIPAMQAEPGNDPSMAYARQASALLGPTLWKRVIQIQNTAADSPYPASLGAVVFEMGGILWFYTSTNGTQSLSVIRDHTKQDEQNFGPLLVLIDSGFTHWELDCASSRLDEKGANPPNACFIQSIALLRHRLSAGIEARHALLLSYYVALPTGTMGHTVLYVETNEGPTLIDPLKQRRPLRLKKAYPADAQAVAYCIRHDISNATWIPIGPNDFSEARAE